MDRLPFRNRVPIWALGSGLGLVMALWLLRQALVPFFVAIVLAYLLAPPVRILGRWMKREFAVLAVLFAAFGFLLLGLWTLMPRMVAQVVRFVDSLPLWRRALEARWGPWLQAHPWILAKARQAADGFDSMDLLKGLQGAGANVLAAFLQAMTLLLVPIIIYYLLLEGPGFLKAVDELIPPRYRPRIRGMVASVHDRLGGYIRGQIAVTLAMSILQGLAFQLMGVPYAWLLGPIAGISNVVPYSPYLTALPPALLLAGLDGATWGRLLVVFLVFTGVQKMETLYFTPVWVGRASRLHPLEVLLGILCFGFAFGLLGLVFAVPLMILVKVVGQTLVADYKAHPWFEGRAQVPGEETQEQA